MIKKSDVLYIENLPILKTFYDRVLSDKREFEKVQKERKLTRIEAIQYAFCSNMTGDKIRRVTKKSLYMGDKSNITFLTYTFITAIGFYTEILMNKTIDIKKISKVFNKIIKCSTVNIAYLYGTGYTGEIVFEGELYYLNLYLEGRLFEQVTAFNLEDLFSKYISIIMYLELKNEEPLDQKLWLGIVQNYVGLYKYYVNQLI